jgi:hypothetical protein
MSGDPSKEELQRRLDHTRDSISQTVTEIKETVANQVQAVKDTLDWREQFKKRPVAWSAGAFGVGLLVGCGLGSALSDKRHERGYSTAIDHYGEQEKSYAAQPVLGAHAAASTAPAPSYPLKTGNGSHGGPGLFQRLAQTPAYDRVKDEAATIGNALVQELSNTAKHVVLPALITSLRNFIGGHLPNAPKAKSQAASQAAQYEPSLEH